MIRFNYPYQTGKEIDYIRDAMGKGRLAGDGSYTHKCSRVLEKYLGAPKVLLTHSCTAALEMAAILADIQPDDEVIMPSYTFVSTANAFVLRRGVPVFVDIRSDTLNIDESKIEDAITDKTKAICVVHYAGVSCEMDAIMDLAKRHGLIVIEDAAQALGSSYKGRKLGTIGDLAAFSFHETKNIVSGEGGALVVNNVSLAERAEIIREKGTNRSQFFRGEVDKYTWVDIGSSFLPSELVAAFLFAQLEEIDGINELRMQKWSMYYEFFKRLGGGKIVLPHAPKECEHNAHMFYLLFESSEIQSQALAFLKDRGIGAVFHYVPLHSSEAGKRYGKVSGDLIETDRVSSRILRLPLYSDLKNEDVRSVCEVLGEFLRE